VARIARVVAPGFPHHVIQRGNRRQKVFFSDDDKCEYLNILVKQAEKYGVKFWAYCLMDNHVHLIVVPSTKESLTMAIGETHRRYTRRINFREGWRGYLWQGRFGSCVLDSSYLYNCVRYVERNPVRAKMVGQARDYKWSSAQAHLGMREDHVISDFYLAREIEDWQRYLDESDDEEKIRIFHEYIATGRPLGDDNFVEKLERITGRELKKNKPGPKQFILDN
jgi:putative transposase